MKMTFMHLTRFRPFEQLVRMDDSDRMELLRRVLEERPSEETWWAICELFALWPESDAKAEAFGLAEAGLSGWDEQLRHMPIHYAGLYKGNRLLPLARLARSIEIYRSEEGDRELFAIATSSDVVHLRGLCIRRSTVVGWGWQAMAESTHLADLRRLHVRRTLLDEADMRLLLDKAHFPHLESLTLRDAGLRNGWLGFANRPDPFPALCAVDLSDNSFGGDSALPLAGADWLKNVQRLHLRRSGVSASLIHALLTSPILAMLEQLDVSGNNLTGDEKERLIRVSQEENVTFILS